MKIVINATCRATNRSGKPCGNSVHLPATVCRMHGGNAPQVMAASKRKLMLLTEDATAWIESVLTTAAANDPIRLACVKFVLDHSGIADAKPDAVDSSHLEFLTDEQLDTMQRWIEEAQVKAREAAGIIDVTPEPNVLRAEQSTSLVYQKRKEAFDAEHLPHATPAPDMEDEE